MKYHALFVILEKTAKFEIVVCCKLLVALLYFIGELRNLKSWPILIGIINATRLLHSGNILMKYRKTNTKHSAISVQFKKY